MSKDTPQPAEVNKAQEESLQYWKNRWSYIVQHNPGRSGNHIEDLINEFLSSPPDAGKEQEAVVPSQKDIEIADLKIQLDILKNGIAAKVRKEASEKYIQWKDDFCKRHNICPVCITGGYDCDSDHK